MPIRIKSHIKISDLFFWLLIGVMLMVSFHTGARSAFLRIALTTGIFNAHAKDDTPKQVKKNLYFIDPNGQVSSLRSLRGKTVFINFWATWCPPCLAEMPSLQKLYLQVKNRHDIVFLTIDADADFAKSSGFLKNQGYDLPLAIASSNVPELLFNGTLPTSVVIDKNGRLVYYHEGIADYSSEKFVHWLKTR